MQSTQPTTLSAIAPIGLSSQDGDGNPPPEGQEVPPSPQGLLANATVLVVEDDLANARLLALILKSEGALVRSARDADEAFAALSESIPQVMVLDLILPRMSGLMLARQLKADPATRGIVIIAVSGINGAETERIALDSGCAAYVAKPIDIDGFLATVRAHLGGRDDSQ